MRKRALELSVFHRGGLQILGPSRREVVRTCVYVCVGVCVLLCSTDIFLSVLVQVFGHPLSSCAVSSERGAAAVGISVSFKSNAYFK